MRQKLTGWAPILARYDSDSWSRLRVDISTGNFATVEFKRIFNAFSDNICASRPKPRLSSSACSRFFLSLSPPPRPPLCVCACVRVCVRACVRACVFVSPHNSSFPTLWSLQRRLHFRDGEANAYLLGGATPSTSQTTQYLLRNEALKQLAELRDEISYQQGLDAAVRDAVVAQETMSAAIKAFGRVPQASASRSVDDGA